MLPVTCLPMFVHPTFELIQAAKGTTKNFPHDALLPLLLLLKQQRRLQLLLPTSAWLFSPTFAVV